MIRLTKLVEFSSAFALSFQVVVEEDDLSDRVRPGDEFNDLWSNL